MMDTKSFLQIVLYVVVLKALDYCTNRSPGTSTSWLRFRPSSRLCAEEGDQEIGPSSSR